MNPKILYVFNTLPSQYIYSDLRRIDVPPSLAVTSRSIDMHRIWSVVGGDRSHHARVLSDSCSISPVLVSAHDTGIVQCTEARMGIADRHDPSRELRCHVDHPRLISFDWQFASVPIKEG